MGYGYPLTRSFEYMYIYKINIIYVLKRVFIEEKLGSKYVEGRSVDFAKSFEETSPTTPIFFILSPGVNPLKVMYPY